MRSAASAVRLPLSPRLLAELHPDRNPGLDVDSLSAGSGRRLWWCCERGHEWQAPVDRRTAGSGCPYCKGSRVAEETSLAAVAPAVAAQWHPTRNGPRTPEHTMPGSDRLAWWRCTLGHEWRASPDARVRHGSGCPYCAGRSTPPERSLDALYPALVAEWHPTRNDGLDPTVISPGSAERVWWRCAKGHEWKAVVKTRVKVRTGCPRCANREQRGIPLALARPDLLAEWHTTLNGGPPGDIMAGSHKQRWWRCRVEPSHVWRAQVRNRVRHGSGCPYCAGKRATAATCLAAVAPEVAAEWHPSRNAGLSPTDILPHSNRKVWWRCPLGHEWVARPANRVRGSRCPHCAS